MLRLPETGIRPSATSHNSDLQLFCDWVESCVLFDRVKRVSRTDIVDVLCEEEFYEDQGFATDWLDNVWTELSRRQRLLKDNAPFNLATRAIERKCPWDAVPAYAFCLLTPLLQNSTKWRKGYDAQALAKHYATQGSLFERISEEALRGAGWQTYRTGWSSTTPARLSQVVAGVAREIGEAEHANWHTNVSPNGNEAGLDVVFYRKFADARCGFPVYLAQCAAGEDWDTKLHTPVLSVWQKLVDFASPPQKAFVLPHSLEANKLRTTTVKVAGMVLDRYRLHDVSPLTNWCSKDLARHLQAFIKPLIKLLPSYS